MKKSKEKKNEKGKSSRENEKECIKRVYARERERKCAENAVFKCFFLTSEI